MFAALADTYLYRIVCRYDTRVARATLCCTAFSWFLFYSSVRTFSNTMEAQLCVVALYYWLGAREPQPAQKTSRDRVIASLLSATAFVVRPTAAIFLAPVIILHLVWTFSKQQQKWTVARGMQVMGGQMALPALAVRGAATVADSVLYGRATCVPLNFFVDNIVHSVAGFYGTHAWHWYATAALPLMLGPSAVLLAAGVRAQHAHRTLPRVLLALALAPVAVYSLLPHKEFRFVLVALYLLMPHCGAGLVALCRKLPGRALAGTLLAAHVALAAFFCGAYQRGPIAVMDALTRAANAANANGANTTNTPVTAVDFLCECHATPFYAYVHTRPGLAGPPFPMRFLDCTPDFAHGLSTARVEDRVFQRSPARFAFDRYVNAANGTPHWALPSHIVSFSTYDAALRPFFQLVGFHPCGSFPHDLSTNVTLFCRRTPVGDDDNDDDDGEDEYNYSNDDLLGIDLDSLFNRASGRDHP